MNRRDHLKLLAAGLPLLISANACSRAVTSAVITSPATLLIKPRPLRRGSKVHLVAPGGPVTEEKIREAILNLQSLGLLVVEGKNIREKRGQHAGTDEQRLADLHTAFADEEAAGIWAIRGGDGSSRLLGQLDYELIRKNPKVLIGFSDITALLQAIQLKTGLIGFHGPIAYWPLTPRNKLSIKALLFGGGAKAFVYEPGPLTTPMVPGRAEGQLAGGNLSVLAALAGTPYALDAREKIVFIEDVNESPRRIDRMLTTLLDADGGNSLRNARGIVLGEFLDCDCERDPLMPDDCFGNSMTLEETLRDRLGGLDIPILTNFPFGHDENLVTFPVGGLAELDAYNNRLTLLESPTVV